MNASQRFLTIYSGVLTLAFGIIVLTGAASTEKVSFDTIDVQRINVREPDGTLRMTISNRAQFPELIFRGKEYDHDRPVAGMLFFSDEGTENGGLVFAGSKGPDGEISHGVHLSMDQYEQDQVVVLNSIEGNGGRRSGLTINDRPTEYSIIDMVEARKKVADLPEDERRAAMAKYREGIAQRLFVGRNPDRESVVTLSDADDNVRLRLKVEPDGAAAIEFLDAEGRVTGTVTPQTLEQ